MQKPVPALATDAVQAVLCQAIIEQKRRARARLPEDTTGDTFGQSRTIARETLGRLAVEGPIVLKPNKGAVVANFTLDEGRDIFTVRRGVVQSVAGHLASHAPLETRAENDIHHPLASYAA